MAHPNIRVEHASGASGLSSVAQVTLDRPERKNACTSGMFAALGDAFREIARSSARAVVLTGAGGDFCAGADVKGEDDGAPRRRGVDSMRDIAATVLAIHGCPKPVIAKVDGASVGAGFGMALAADMIWCSERARFSLIFSRRGLSLDFGTSWLLPRRVGLHEAKRLAFTGEIIDARRAASLGIVNEVLPAEALDAAVDTLAEQIVSGPPIALAASKRYLDAAAEVSLATALEAETLGQAVNFATADFAEAMRAFADKRAASFEGR